MRNDDSDIKIFNPSSKDDRDHDILNLVESIDHHRRNGNILRARKLGQKLSEIAMEPETMDELLAGGFESPEDITEAGVLLLFSTEAALNYFLPTTQLSAIAISSLHECLDETKSEFFTNVVESPAYSFYYLSVRKGGEDVDRNIGEAFAMLCHHEGDETYIEKGKAIYNMALHEVEKDVRNADFAE